MWTAIGRISFDDAGRRGEAFDGANALLEPPAIFGGPVLEFAVETEIVGPVLCDIGIELGLPADGDEVGLTILQDGFGLLGFQNDADRHRRDARLLADPFRIS